MRWIIPRTRMGIFTGIVGAAWLMRILLIPASALSSLSPILRFLLNLPFFLLVVPAVYYAWRLGSGIRRKLLWKIRRRIILAHIFIGFIPILLVIIIVNVAGILFYYQLIYYLIENQIKIHSTQVHAFNRFLIGKVEGLQTAPAADQSAIQSAIGQDFRYLLANYPTASLILRMSGPSPGKQTSCRFHSAGMEILTDYSVPDWARAGEFSGLVAAETGFPAKAPGDAATSENTQEGLYLKSLVFSGIRSRAPFSLELSVPFDNQMLGRLKAALGSELFLAKKVATSDLQAIQMNPEILQQNIRSATFDIENNARQANGPVWSILLFPVSWRTGVPANSASSDVLFVEISTAKLLQNVMRSGNSVSKTIFGVLELVIGFFLVAEIISLVIGFLLTRSITNAVHNLDRGTEFIKRGDFSHRIVVRSEDQLGALAKSFNQMTEYIQDLVKERVLKERLERELEIAQEVQEQSFPRSAPRMGRLDLSGLCLPARVVSGDYYDFLPLSADRLGMALGDICGKGISAALLMANLQATLRSNVLNLSRQTKGASEQGSEDGAVARVVGRLNQQIYSYTAANKFASFFYAVYDDTRLSLTYCNAGHNPPLYFNNGGVQRLDTGGTVVGVFADALYVQESISLAAGDVIVAYTDGITESVNEYGEEFGEERLITLIEENRGRSAGDIQKTVFDRVLSWGFDEERHDDMTIIVGKIV